MDNIFSKSRIRFQELYQDALNFFTQKYNQSRKVFTISSAWGQILHAVTKLAEPIMYYIEDSVTESNINTASRAESVRGLARLTGHDAVRSIAATGEISMKWNGSDPGINTNQIVIPNFTKLTCLNNGLPYVIDIPQEEVRVKMLTTRPAVRARIVQGEIQSQTFTGTGEPLQSFEVIMKNGRMIDQFFYNVYVNGDKCEVYDSLYDIPKDKLACLVKTGIGSGIDVYFGNGYFGAIPPAGSSVRVEYLVNDGDGGNLRDMTGVGFEFTEPGYDLVGNEIDLNSVLEVNVTQPIELGSNAEPLAMTRLLAPKMSRSFVLANPINYVYFLEKFNYFSQIHAYNTFEDQYIDDDNVVYLFLVPDIQKRIFNNETYFTVPLKYFSMSDDEKQKIYDLIDNSGSKLVTSVVKIVDPIFKKYVINISLVVFEGFSLDLIKEQIAEKFSDYFLTLRRRDRIPKSDLISIVEDIEGVDSVSIFFLSEENEKDPTTNAGMDEYGDIIIGRDEIPLMRGGWSDRNGTYFEDSAAQDRPSSLNIEIRKIIPLDYNAKMNILNKKTIK